MKIQDERGGAEGAEAFLVHLCRRVEARRVLVPKPQVHPAGPVASGRLWSAPRHPNEPQAGAAVLLLLWLDWKPGPVAGKGWGTGDETCKPMSQEHRSVGTSSEHGVRP